LYEYISYANKPMVLITTRTQMFSKTSRLLILITSLFFMFTIVSCGGSSPSDDISIGVDKDEQEDPAAPTPTPNAEPQGRVWTVEEVLAEPRKGGAGGAASCGGEFGFKRCVCAPDVRSSMRYRPALAECNGNAAAILDGEYLDAFSIVVRDSQNRDRWPVAGSGFGGCSAELANSESPPNRCSAFKVQDKFLIADDTARVHCFGASGYSELFSDVVRVTIKNSDNPFSNDDDIDRLCLVSGSEPLN
jgi:hypothetical protein